MRIFEILLIVLLLILIVLHLVDISLECYEKGTVKKIITVNTAGVILPKKPKLPNYLPNSDFIFNKSGWLSNQTIPPEAIVKDIIEDASGWKSDGFVEMEETSDGRRGILILHPVTESIARYIETPEFLLPSSGYLAIGVANLAGKLSYLGSENADNIFKIYVIDSDTGLQTKIDEFTIASEDGWKDIIYSIPKFMKNLTGKIVKIRVESWAGGSEVRWYTELGGIDYIDII